MGDLDQLAFARIKTQIQYNANSEQRAALSKLLIDSDLIPAPDTYTSSDVEAVSKVQAHYFGAVLDVQSIASALIAAALSNNGKENRRLIRGLKSDFIAALDRLKDVLRDVEGYSLRGLFVNTEYAQMCLPLWRKLYNATDGFIAAGETDAAKAELQQFAAIYNDDLKPYTEPLTKSSGRRAGMSSERKWLAERVILWNKQVKPLWRAGERVMEEIKAAPAMTAEQSWAFDKLLPYFTPETQKNVIAHRDLGVYLSELVKDYKNEKGKLVSG